MNYSPLLEFPAKATQRDYSFTLTPYIDKAARSSPADSGRNTDQCEENSNVD
jgi:hypothetical protein